MGGDQKKGKRTGGGRSEKAKRAPEAAPGQEMVISYEN
jgi:hypothetical protein